MNFFLGDLIRTTYMIEKGGQVIMNTVLLEKVVVMCGVCNIYYA